MSSLVAFGLEVDPDVPLYTHHFRLDEINHCIVSPRKNHRGRDNALCGIDLTGSQRRPPERTETTCPVCVRIHTNLADFLERSHA